MSEEQRKPFEPLGEVARWQVLYDLLRSTKTGDVLTYDDMARALDLDPVKDRHAIQMSMRRAATQHEHADKRAVDAVTNEGYRVVEAVEHLSLAQRHQRKAGKSIVRSKSKVDNVDFNELDSTSRAAFELVGRALGMQQEMIRRLDVRQRRLDEAVTAVTTTAQRTVSDLAGVDERLRWLEEQETKRASGE